MEPFVSNSLYSHMSLRDPVKFPDLVHALMRDPRGLKTWVHRWDFWGLTPEATHQVSLSVIEADCLRCE